MACNQCQSCNQCSSNCNCNYNHHISCGRPTPCNPCTNTCPTGCTNFTSSDCVIIKSQYTCLGIGIGETLTSALGKVEDLCNGISSTGGTGLVHYGYGTGDWFVSSVDPGTNIWSPGSNSSYTDNLSYIATKTGLYKFTVEIHVGSFDELSYAQVGIGINSANPDTSSQFTVSSIPYPLVSGPAGGVVVTLTFILPLNLGQKGRVMIRLTSGTLVEFDPIKLIVERVELQS